MSLRPRTVLNNVGMEFAQFTTGLAVDRVVPSLTGALKGTKSIRFVNNDGTVTESGDEDFGLTLSEEAIYTKRTVLRAEAAELRLQQVPEDQHGHDAAFDVVAAGGTDVVLRDGTVTAGTVAAARVAPADGQSLELGPEGVGGAPAVSVSAEATTLASARVACTGGVLEAAGKLVCSTVQPGSAGGNTQLALGRAEGRLTLDSGAVALRAEAGALAAPLAAEPGTAAVVRVAVAETLPGLAEGALLLVGGGELLRVTAVQLLEGGVYTLTAARGQRGTDPAAHAVGAQVRVVQSAGQPSAVLFAADGDGGATLTVHGSASLRGGLASDVFLSAPEVAASVLREGTAGAGVDVAAAVLRLSGELSAPTLRADLVRPRDGSATLTVGGPGTTVLADVLAPSGASMRIGTPSAESGLTTTVALHDNVTVGGSLTADTLRVRELAPLVPGQSVVLNFDVGLTNVAANTIAPQSGDTLTLGTGSATRLVLLGDASLSGTLAVDRVVPSAKLSVGALDGSASVLRVKTLESPDGALQLSGTVSMDALAISSVQTPVGQGLLTLGRAEAGAAVRAQGDHLEVVNQLRTPQVRPSGTSLALGDPAAATLLYGSALTVHAPARFEGALTGPEGGALQLGAGVLGAAAEFQTVRAAHVLPRTDADLLVVGASRTDQEVQLKAAVRVDTIKHFVESNADKAINVGVVDSRVNLSRDVHVAGTLFAPLLSSDEPFVQVTASGGLAAAAVEVDRILTGSTPSAIQLGNDAGSQTRVSGTLAVSNIVHDSVATPYDLSITVGTEGTKSVKIGTFPSTTVEIYRELIVHGPLLGNGVISTDANSHVETPKLKVTTIEPLDQTGADPLILFRNGKVAMETLRVQTVSPFSGDNVSVTGTIRTAAIYHPLESADNVLQVGNADTNLRLLSDTGVTVGPGLTTPAADVATLTVSTITSNTPPIQIAAAISLPQINTETIRPLPEADPPVISIGKSGADITLREDVRITGDASVEQVLRADRLAARDGTEVHLEPGHALLATTLGTNAILPLSTAAGNVIEVGDGTTTVEVHGTLETNETLVALQGLTVAQGKEFSVSSAALEVSDSAAELQLRKDTKVFGDLTITGDLVTDAASLFAVSNLEATNTLFATRIDGRNEDDELHIKKPVTIAGGLNVTEYVRAPNFYGNLRNSTGGTLPVYLDPLVLPGCPPEGPLEYVDAAGALRTVDNGAALPELRVPWGAAAALGNQAHPVDLRPNDDEFVFPWNVQHVVPAFGMVVSLDLLADSLGGALVGRPARVAFFKNGHPLCVGFQAMRRHPTQDKLVGPYASGATYQHEDSVNGDGTANVTPVRVDHADPWMTLWWEPERKTETVPSSATATSAGGTAVRFTLTPFGAVDLTVTGAQGVFFSSWRYSVDGDVQGGATPGGGTVDVAGSGSASLTVQPGEHTVQVALVSGEAVLADHTVTIPFALRSVDTGACRLRAKTSYQEPGSGLFQHKNILQPGDLLTLVVHNLAVDLEVSLRGCFLFGQLGVTNEAAPGGADGHYAITDFLYTEPYVERDVYAVDVAAY